MQCFGVQTRLFSEVTGPQQLSEQKEVSNGPQKVTDPIFVNPSPEGLLNNAKSAPLKFRGMGLQRMMICEPQRRGACNLALARSTLSCYRLFPQLPRLQVCPNNPMRPLPRQGQPYTSSTAHSRTSHRTSIP